MPLIHGKSKEAMGQNIKTEMHAGKPQKQSIAIAYNMARKAAHKKMAHGGEVCHACGGQINPKLQESKMSQGGMVHDQDEKPTPVLGTGMYSHGGRVTEEETEHYDMPGEYDEEEAEGFSEGGGVDSYDATSMMDADGDSDDLEYSPEVSADNYEHQEEDGEDESKNKFLRAYMIHRKLRR